jgi:hypothetical protein
MSIKSKDKQASQMMDLIRSLMARSFGGHQNPALYEKAITGTKHIIDAFQQSMKKCLHFLKNSNIPNKKVL